MINVHTYARIRASGWREAVHELEQRDRAIIRCLEALEACREYLDCRADAELDSAGYTGNEEMRLLVDVEAAIRKAAM